MKSKWVYVNSSLKLEPMNKRSLILSMNGKWVFSRTHLILYRTLKPTFAFFVSQSKACLVLNGLLHFLPDQFRQQNSPVMKVHHHTLSVFVLFHVDPILKINLCQVHCNIEGSRNLTGDICFHHSTLSIILMLCSKSPLSFLLTSNVTLC